MPKMSPIVRNVETIDTENAIITYVSERLASNSNKYTMNT